MAENVAPLIVKKKKVVGGDGHHGGAWKVAYADFVTAMMAFFLLMWLLNATSEEQRKGLADFFDPALPISRNSAGGAGMLAGDTMFSSERAAGSTKTGVRPQPSRNDEGKDLGDEQTSPDLPATEHSADQAPAEPRPSDDWADDPSNEVSANELGHSDAELEALQTANAALEAARQGLDDVLRGLDDPSESEQVIVHMTPEGLVIELVDREGRSLFESGSAVAGQRLERLMAVLVPVLETVENPIRVVGHTDALPYGASSDYTNWELSSDRANAARRLLESQGLPVSRISGVAGRAATEPLTDDPLAPHNRRIAITVLRNSAR